MFPQDTEGLYIGARGTNTKLFHDLSPEGVDAFSPSNPVIVGTGPLTGTSFPMSGRFLITSKSPQTGTIFTSSCGGWFGVTLKKSGVDALVVTGKAQEPSYIYIERDTVRIISANDLWGQDKQRVRETLKAKHGNQISIMLIGKAGENLVRFSNLENDGSFIDRGGGLGAVMGSKKIKAIVVKGKSKITIADKENLAFMAYECKKWLSANPITSTALPEFGTGVFLNLMKESGLLSTRNFRFPAPEQSANISGEKITELILRTRKACPFCPVACGRTNAAGTGPEFESLWALGVNLGIYDIFAVTHLNNICNEQGLDIISTGGTLAMAAELTESGSLPFEIRYDDPSGTEAAIHNIAERKDDGELLSMGSKELGRIYGVPDISPHVKGLELPPYDPRGAYGHALGYATSNKGGCHLQGYLIGAEILGIPKLVNRHSIQGKASLLAFYQNAGAFMDSLAMCRFSSFAVPQDYYARIATAATGRTITWEDSLRAGERIWNLEKLINLREGVEEDCLPGRFNDVPVSDMLIEYYEIRGWDKSGKPLPETISRLKL